MSKMSGSKDSLHGVDLDAALDRAEWEAAGRRLRAGAALRPDPAFARQLEGPPAARPDASDPAAAPLATAGPRPPPPRRRRDRAARRPRTGRRRRAGADAAARPGLCAERARRAVDGRQLGHDLNLSQTANGFTVTVGRVYADANEITIGYTVTGPPGRDYVTIAVGDGAPTLIDARGQRLKVAPRPRVQGEQQAGLMHYETRMDWALRVTERPAAPTTYPARSSSTTARADAYEVGGTTVRIVATPVSTRVYLRGSGPNVYADLRGTTALDPAGMDARQHLRHRSRWATSGTSGVQQTRSLTGRAVPGSSTSRCRGRLSST